MKIMNQSSTTISISGSKIRPGEEGHVVEMCFDSHIISTIGGYVEIDTEYSNRHIRNFGNIMAEEGDEIDPETELRTIIVKDRNQTE